jgi:hypothetical protein
MKRKLTAIALAVTLISGIIFAPARAAQTNPFANIPVVRSINGGGTFDGVLFIGGFTERGEVLVAISFLSGSFTDAAGNIVGSITNLPFELPLTSTQGTTCQILHLELGPLDLNSLGLTVYQDMIILDITDQSATSMRARNLLCSTSKALKSNASLKVVAHCLNWIIALWD